MYVPRIPQPLFGTIRTKLSSFRHAMREARSLSKIHNPVDERRRNCGGVKDPKALVRGLHNGSMGVLVDRLDTDMSFHSSACTNTFPVAYRRQSDHMQHRA